MNILIAGASGNLGSQLAAYLLPGPHQLRLMVHNKPLPFNLDRHINACTVRADLNSPSSIREATKDIDCIVYLAGVLFQPRPKTFLHKTNTVYVQTIVDAALASGVRKFIFVSFPHVEGESTPDAPARGILDCRPRAIHSRTRLEAEKYLLNACSGQSMKALVFRAGVIYGRGVKLTEAARTLMRKRLLTIWNKPTWVHLLALADFLKILKVALERDDLSGIYNLADDEPVTLQDFLDRLAAHWGYGKPWRLPSVSFHVAAMLCETFATVFRTSSPLTRDIVDMGMTSVVADTTRMKKEIVPELIFPTFKEGMAIL